MKYESLKFIRIKINRVESTRAAPQNKSKIKIFGSLFLYSIPFTILDTSFNKVLNSHEAAQQLKLSINCLFRCIYKHLFFFSLIKRDDDVSSEHINVY